MKKENNENLNELLTQFLDADQASRAAADIAAGTQIFAASPAPIPSAVLLATIKYHMAAAQKQRSHRYFVKQIAAAAVIFIVAGMSIVVLLHNRNETRPYASQAFWQELPENSVELQLSQLEQADTDMPLITLEENGNDPSAMSDVTDELDEISGTFWEG